MHRSVAVAIRNASRTGKPELAARTDRKLDETACVSPAISSHSENVTKMGVLFDHGNHHSS